MIKTIGKIILTVISIYVKTLVQGLITMAGLIIIAVIVGHNSLISMIISWAITVIIYICIGLLIIAFLYGIWVLIPIFWNMVIPDSWQQWLRMYKINKGVEK